MTAARSLVIGTAGHIDHGKSTLVRALTGTDPDRLKEEQARGITIDLGFAHAEMDGVNVAFVDVPGHERFVKNMLAGVGGIDAVLLVIAADESVKPQTREHFAICRLLQIPDGVIALTKADLVDADMLALVTLEARELVAGSPLASAEILPVSAKTSQGLDELRGALARIAARVPERRSTGVARLPVDRVFSMRGFGTVVTGTLTSGSIHTEQEMVALPSARRVKVRGMQVHGTAQDAAVAGRRVALNLAGVEVADLQRGETLTVEGALEATRRVDVVLELLPDAPPLKHGARVRVHHGTMERLGRVALAGGLDPGVESGALAPGASAFARIRLEGPAVLTRGDRIVLRAYSPPTTIGGARVIDPLPARTPIRTAAARARFARLNGTTADAVHWFVEERAGAGLSLDEAARRSGLTVAEATAIASELAAHGRVMRIGSRLFDAALVRTLETRLLAAVDEHHRGDAMSEGWPREEARGRVFGRAAAELFDDVLARLGAAGTLVVRDRLAIPGRGSSLTPEEAHAASTLDRAFLDARFAPPDLASAASAAGLPAALADRVARHLQRQKRLVKIDTLLFHADALAQLKREVMLMKESGSAARVDVAAFKERYGISRKYAIPLLEWLDRERVTRRVGDARVIL
ncbi:MAG: selenocysteine-specific translation elongation factor [Acidobacteria bacterium]|nr:selenocysteine-specific translation elongation factor [Acidobacteriota bacterium]